MNPDPLTPEPNPGAVLPTGVGAPPPWWQAHALHMALGVAAVSLVVSGALWQKLSSIQEQLARQSADATAQATEARATARQAQELARETAARQAVADAKISEVSLQRSQLEELMQSLSRSRDENLVVDIESALRLAQQQALLTGSVEPLMAALRTADQRVARAAQPRLAPLQRALTRDLDRVKAATVTDTPGLLNKLDELARLTDELPLANTVALTRAGAGEPATPAGTPIDLSWWRSGLGVVLDEVRALVRVGRIDHPEAALLTPEQSFFLRENLKLKLLNARLGLLARQHVAARADVLVAQAMLGRYFDGQARKTQVANGLLQQVQAQMKTMELPRLDESLSALATAAAGR